MTKTDGAIKRCTMVERYVCRLLLASQTWADVARIINHPDYRDDSTINDISILGKLQFHFSIRAFLERQSYFMIF